MPSRNSDRNLLFGILALQLDFISGESLIKAMNDWVLNKEKPLGEVLHCNGVLSKRNRELLEQIVDAHLAEHNGDPVKSLAATQINVSIREQIEQIDADDLTESLLQVPTPTAEESADATVSFVRSSIETGEQSSLGSRYQIVRPHAEGGLGKVSVALDRELNREVALKEIKEGLAHDEAARSRFVMEAEITGGLEHPGIVPVYGLGYRKDGQPFYAMRFIKGDSLKEACTKYHEKYGQQPSIHRTIESRKLLGRFVDVCNAIEYAHSRGVVHRDLKPGNIMLGRYGETLVVDWGLAKAIGRSTSHDGVEERTIRPSSSDSSYPTQMGSAIGTPHFMSPEQAAGNLDKLGPASDVYSLGATLYYLLVNKLPFSGEKTDSILERVQRGDFDAPRTVDPKLPKPLDAICQKAMALESTERYTSPSDLASDIERWLADEPITCYREQPLERSWRWLRHHRQIVQTTFAVLLASLIALTVILSLREQHSRQLDHANDRLSQRNERLRETIDAYVDTVQQDELLQEEQFQPLRKRLLENALTHYQNFVRETEQSDAELDELADAVFRVAWISASTGDLETAIDSYREAIQLQRSIVRSNPLVADHRHKLAGSYNNLGLLYSELGNSKEAIATLEKAVEQSRRSVELDPDEPFHQMFLANHYRCLFDAYPTASDSREAKGLLGEALVIYQELESNDPTNPLYQNGVAEIYTSIGLLYERTGSIEMANQHFQDALESSEQLVEEHPDVIAFQRTQLVSYNCLGNSHRLAGRFDESKRFFKLAISIGEELVRKNPNLAELRHDLVKSLVGLGQVISKGRDTENVEAFEALQRAVDVANGLVKEHPSSADFRNHMAIAQCNLGNLFLESGNTQDAIEHYVIARKNHLEVLSIDPNDPRANAAMISTLLNLGRAHGNQGNSTTELEFIEDAIRHGEMNLEHAQVLPEFQSLLADAYLKRSRALLSTGQRDEAKQDVESALKLLELIVDGFPEMTKYQGQLAFALNRRGEVLVLMGQNISAVGQFERAKDLYVRLCQVESPLASDLFGLAESYAALGHGYALIGNWEQEEESYLRAKERWTQLVDIDPSNASYQEGHANLLTNLGNSYLDNDRVPESTQLLKQALEIRGELVRNHPMNRQYQSGLATSQGAMGTLLADLGEYHEALELLNQSISTFSEILAESPSNQSAQRFVQTARYFKTKTLKQAAWDIATDREASGRNAQMAKDYATQACEITEWKDFESLAVLAACHALAGEVEQAVEWQKKSIELAPADHVDTLNAHLLLYQDGKRVTRPND